MPPQGFRPSQDFRPPQGFRPSPAARNDQYGQAGTPGEGRPSPAARNDRTPRDRAKRPAQPATGKFGMAIVIGWIVLWIFMSLLR